jgi:hypothetical protein
MNDSLTKKDQISNTVICKCGYCGKKFKKLASALAHGRGKYCSKECARKAKQKTILKKCEICRKEFTVTPFYSKQKTCSTSCKNQWISKNQ